MTDAIDLTDILPKDEATLEILKPGGGDPTGWLITFAGPAHPKTVTASNESARRDLRRARQIEAAQVNGRKFKPEEREPDEIRGDNIDWVVSRIIGWTPIKIAGEVIEYSDAAAKALFLRREMGFALSQCMEFLSDERSFSKASAIN